MDNQLDILLILHFAIKMKDDTHSSDDSYILMGLTQNKVSQYFSGKSKMPRASRIAMAQHIMRSLKIGGATHRWLDTLSVSRLDNVYVSNLIDYIITHGKLNSARGRTESMAQHILQTYQKLIG